VGPALVAAGAFALNDFFDVASDAALNRRDRPIVAGELSKGSVLKASIALYAAGLGLCLYASGWLAFSIAFAYAVLSVAYSAVLKRTLLAGNLAVATTYAISFVYGSAIATGTLNVQPTIACFAAMAFFAGLARELLNSIKDMEGDKKLHALSLPMLLDAKPVAFIAGACVVAAVALSALPLLQGVRIPYVLLVGACDALLLHAAYSALNDLSYANLSRVRKQTIFALLVGVIGFASLAAG
jgi:4-hydroxybenzoate polyprenyltransferase